MEKGIFGLDILVAKMRWISGMALARVGIKDHLSMKNKYAQVQVQRGAQKPNQRTTTRKKAKRKSCENQGVTNLPPLEKSCPRDLVAQGTIANLPSLGNLLLLGLLLTTYCSHKGIQYISTEGVYFTRSTVLTECSFLTHHTLSF